MKNLTTLFLVFLVSFGLYGQNQNISNGNIFDGEPYIIMNPNNPDHLVVAWMGWAGVGNRIIIKTRASFDGGGTWSAVVELPHVDPSYTSADCSMAFDSNGNLYVSYIDSTGTDSSPIEGGIYLCKSADGGLTFDAPTEVLNINADPPRIPVDRPWISIDRSQTATDGFIYITSMNAAGAMTDYHPYLSISTDGGNSFEWKDLDTPGWLSGNAIERPMPAPTVSESGVLHAIYPSYVVSQNILPQYIIASSNNGGSSFTYNSVFASATTPSNDPLPKLGYILRSSPANSAVLAFVYPANVNADLDIFMRLSEDAGVSWSDAIRVNDDSVGNDIMQDLVWADFDTNGDLVVSWRDRRNGNANTYETASEIWAAFLPAGSTAFETNFQLTSELVSYNNVLASAGNDFMSIQLDNGIIHATWGDPRADVLNIWYQRSLTDGTILGLQEIAIENRVGMIAYPNPTTEIVNIGLPNAKGYKLYDSAGKLVKSINNLNEPNYFEINMKRYNPGIYFVECYDETKTYTSKIIKE